MLRIGTGYDIHALVDHRPLMVGGIEIPWDKGESGHSDGDVLFHAIIDAVLGALALGDIGTHFPSEDKAWKDTPGINLFRNVLEVVESMGWKIGNIDSTVILEEPKLRPHIGAIRKKIADSASIAESQVSIKGKTKEGFGPIGSGEAIEAQAVVSVVREDEKP